MIWPDALDPPMYQAIPVNFTERYEERHYPSMEAPESMHNPAWKPVIAALTAASVPMLDINITFREDDS